MAAQLPALTLQIPGWSLLRLSELFAYQRLEQVVLSRHGSRLVRECICDLHMSWLIIPPYASRCGVFLTVVLQNNKRTKVTNRLPRVLQGLQPHADWPREQIVAYDDSFSIKLQLQQLSCTIMNGNRDGILHLFR